jgi:hypothetical protein
MCCHTKGIETGSPCSKLQKPDTLFWQTGGSNFVRTDGGAALLRRGTPPLAM